MSQSRWINETLEKNIYSIETFEIRSTWECIENKSLNAIVNLFCLQAMYRKRHEKDIVKESNKTTPIGLCQPMFTDYLIKIAIFATS